MDEEGREKGVERTERWGGEIREKVVGRAERKDRESRDRVWENGETGLGREGKQGWGKQRD